MNVGYEQMLSLTWKEFDYYQQGYNRRVERGWDYTRHIIATLANVNRGKNTSAYSPKDIIPLPLLDGYRKPKVIRRIDPERKKQLLKFLEQRNV